MRGTTYAAIAAAAGPRQRSADIPSQPTTQAGVHVTLHIGDGLPHVYPIMLGTPEAAEATEQTGNFLRTWVEVQPGG